MVTLVEANSPEMVCASRQLFQEYAAGIGVDLCFQNFDEELAGLPGKYAPPEGRLILATSESGYLGCVALRKLAEGICEMKRLYVRPSFRGQGIGRALAMEVIAQGRKIGYGAMRLDTLASMKDAIALYESLGFRQIGPYCRNPERDAVFMELDLKI